MYHNNLVIYILDLEKPKKNNLNSNFAGHPDFLSVSYSKQLLLQ